jgi:hypothetical protein
MTSLSAYDTQRRVWRYQRGNQNPYIEEEQTTRWPKEKVQKYKQRSTKYTQKSKDRVTRTPLKTGGEQTYTHNNNLLWKYIVLEKTSYEPYYNPNFTSHKCLLYI